MDDDSTFSTVQGSNEPYQKSGQRYTFNETEVVVLEHLRDFTEGGQHPVVAADEYLRQIHELEEGRFCDIMCRVSQR